MHHSVLNFAVRVVLVFVECYAVYLQLRRVSDYSVSLRWLLENCRVVLFLLRGDVFVVVGGGRFRLSVSMGLVMLGLIVCVTVVGAWVCWLLFVSWLLLLFALRLIR